MDDIVREELDRFRKQLEIALSDLLIRLGSQNLRWTRDQFEEWLQHYVLTWRRIELVDLPLWRAASTLDDTQSFLFHFRFNNNCYHEMIIVAMAITQAAMPPDYLAITRAVAG